MDKQGDFQYEYFSSVTQHNVEWLWYPYIPYGKLTILQGDPGEGKSTFILNVAALLTRGKDMPDGFRVPEAQRVVYQTAEDNIADTVKPRLVAAGADCDKVAYIVDDEFPLTLEDDRIEKVIEQTGARLFILDPLQGYLSQDSDMTNAGRMRSQLKRLADIASRHRCAVVIVGPRQHRYRCHCPECPDDLAGQGRPVDSVYVSSEIEFGTGGCGNCFFTERYARILLDGTARY